MTIRIAPSIIAADFGRLAEEVARVEAAGADMIHVDVMDGHFVPNITLGIPVVEGLARATRLPLDVHLMITEPDRYLTAFANAGASVMTIHAEAAPHLERTVEKIKALGRRAGVAISPGTPVDALAPVISSIDVALVMSVNPGFTGQAFMPQSIPKVRDVRALISARAGHADIEVDGGVGVKNAHTLVEAGATILVAGAAVFHAPDCDAAMRALRQAAAGA